jgi:hypothetical protein
LSRRTQKPDSSLWKIIRFAELLMPPLGQGALPFFSPLAIQGFQSFLPNATFAPSAEMVIDRFPGWKIGRQQLPLGAGFNDVQNGINDPFPRMLASTSLPMSVLKASLYPRPFLIPQITRLAQRSCATCPGTLTLLPCFHKRLLRVVPFGTKTPRTMRFTL